MSEEGRAITYCGNCKTEIDNKDTICKHCGRQISEVGKGVTIYAPTARVGLSADMKSKLNKKELSTFDKIREWWDMNVSEFEVSEIEIGFPSGIKIKFGKYKDEITKG